MRGWWQDLTDLVLPAECGGCGRPRTVLCPKCRAVLSGVAARRVRPVPEPPGLPVVHAAARYADEVRATLLAHKERGALALAGPLGVALAGAVRAGLRTAWGGSWAGAEGAWSRAAGAPVLLVPVPSGRRAVRARGHDPARRIALAAAGELRRSGVPARVLGVLRQRRAVADQSELNSRQRLDNLAGALAVVPGGARLLSGGPVVLVDDVMTTGASLAEAARAVRAAGPVSSAAGAAAVYGGETWESREEQNVGTRRERTGRRPGRQGMTGAGGAGGTVDMVCAAVVAASPDSFEINRN
ncbi:putative amidophosphoribosyltransferase [Streptomyces africanus]|uniref:Amidophosphoribosyltransferase n=1 Tax=Streptomyces africanus TaxID=231024 RepID=A0ABU0QQP4_9ACTN|nr:phosphoribosyltransferase family protein [Streptomyces africanus]MDQ0748874.1 putative amidophosphoribosyltransferase [Streptomyces africanus]